MKSEITGTTLATAPEKLYSLVLQQAQYVYMRGGLVSWGEEACLHASSRRLRGP